MSHLRSFVCIRRGRAVLAAAAALATAATTAPVLSGALASAAVAAVASPSFVLHGSGWGHGVGMSQYGAYAQARAGRSAATILGMYFPGTSLGNVDDTATAVVNLLHDTSSTTFGVAGVAGGTAAVALTVPAGSTVTQTSPPPASNTPTATASDTTTPTTPTPTTTPSPTPTGGSVLPADTVLLTATSAATFRIASDSTRGVMVTSSDGRAWSVQPAAPLRVTWSGATGGPNGANGLLKVTGPTGGYTTYRYGQVSLRWDRTSTGSNLETVLTLPVAAYLLGIGEMPSSWGVSGAAALQAQAIVARTYALRAVAANSASKRASCACQLYDTTADQVYVGWSKESDPTYGAYWRAAVTATAGKAVTYQGALAQTYYSSSNGGRTESAADVWGGSVPYLTSVADPWSLSSVNPNRAWSATISQAKMASAFGLPDVMRLDLSRRTAGGGIRQATATSSSGATATLSGATLASRLGLRARWVQRTIDRAGGADRFATAVAIAATVSSPASVAVLANGEDEHLVDGVVAGPLADAARGVVLLADTTSLPAATTAELTRRRPSTVYLVGGTAALGPQVQAQLAQLLPGTTVVREGGADRYETAALVSREARRLVPASTGAASALVAPGDNAQALLDALVAAGPAAALSRPLLLVSKTSLPASTAAALKDLGITSTTVVATGGSVADSVVAQLPAPVAVRGADQVATAAAVATAFSASVGTGTVVLAKNAGAPVDALAAASLGRLILLTDPVALPTATAQWLQSHGQVDTVLAVGGTAVVSAATLTAAAQS
ncbi:MAG: SpoIID/LytB domain-containing protein [Actinomycetes bacterium]